MHKQWRHQYQKFGTKEGKTLKEAKPSKSHKFDHFVQENDRFSWFHSNLGGGQDIFIFIFFFGGGGIPIALPGVAILH